MTVRNYRDLIAWQKAMDLVELVDRATESFPQHEVFGIRQQIRRAAVSVPSNIAEGQGRDSPREFAKFLAIAHGSLREIETQLLIAQRLQYLNDVSTHAILDLCGDVGRLMTGLRTSLRNRNP
jgi:four helix bundle protein